MDKISKYRIEELIGRGGCGRVYRAFDPTVNRTVAIKVLLVDGEWDMEELLSRFRAEASTTGKLIHKNIVTIYDYCEDNGNPYLVMEHLQGRDLRQILSKNDASLTFLEKVSLMQQVAEGLQFAHTNRIVHRDVKPANIMLLDDGNVKIMDFGIATLLYEQVTRMTQTGQLIGTPLYMSPEQHRGEKVDFLTDIFAYGVTYYELATGRHPFLRANSDSDVASASFVHNLIYMDPPPICDDAVSGSLERVIFKAVSKTREQRYQSFDELLLDVAPIKAKLQWDLAAEKVREAERLFAVGEIDRAHKTVCDSLRLVPSNDAAQHLREKIQGRIQAKPNGEYCDPTKKTVRTVLNIKNHDQDVRLSGDRKNTVPKTEKASREGWSRRRPTQWQLSACFLGLMILLSLISVSSRPWPTTPPVPSNQNVNPTHSKIDMPVAPPIRSTLGGSERLVSKQAPIVPSPDSSGERVRPGLVATSTNNEEMVLIQEGEFLMGSPHSELERPANQHESPQHKVLVNRFWMDPQEVTNTDYRRFIVENTNWQKTYADARFVDDYYLKDWNGTHYPIDKGEHPVTTVSWFAATAYCNWRDKRLPTEAEWEYAARAGTMSAFWWGDQWDGAHGTGNSRNGSSSIRNNDHRNPFGLFDMLGNVWEWTSTLYKDYPYDKTDGREEQTVNAKRVTRGGSWADDDTFYLRSAVRYPRNSQETDGILGFRCARSYIEG